MTAVAKRVLTRERFIQFTNTYDSRTPLYHQKLKPLLPQQWQNRLSSDLWERVAQFCFHLHGLRCDLSGELLRNPVWSIECRGSLRLQTAYEETFLKHYNKLNEKSVTKFQFEHFSMDFSYDVNYFAYCGDKDLAQLTAFAMKHDTLRFDAIDKETQEFLKMVSDYYKNTNILKELKIAIEAEKISGGNEFALAKFLSQYNYPVMDKELEFELDLYPRIFIMIFFVMLEISLYISSCAIKRDAIKFMMPLIDNFFLMFSENAEYYYRIVQLMEKSPVVFLLLLGHAWQFNELFISFLHESPGEKDNTPLLEGWKLKFSEINAVKLMYPTSIASSALKWILLATDLAQLYFSSALSVSKQFQLVVDLLWIVSPTTDIGCRKTVEEFKQVIKDPTQLVTLGPLRDAYGFFKKPGFLRSGILERTSFVLLAAIGSYLATENPLLTLLAMVNALQLSSLTGVLTINRQQYKLFANKPVFGAVELKSADELQLVRRSAYC